MEVKFVTILKVEAKFANILRKKIAINYEICMYRELRRNEISGIVSHFIM